jgi:hypothetical protein
VRFSHSFPAPVPVVLDALTDPKRVARWLPTGVRVTAAGAAWQVGPHEYRVHRDADTVSWEPVGAGWPGRATVEASPSGASILHVLVKGVPVSADPVVDEILQRFDAELRHEP